MTLQRQTIINQINNNQVVILSADTGSGKTTQIPQFLLQEYSQSRICVTQPRRVAAISVANRVAYEYSRQGSTRDTSYLPTKDYIKRYDYIISYSVRFDDRSTQNTQLRYVTDGVLARQLINHSKNNSQTPLYPFVIIDEAHERSLQTDFLFALLKRELIKHPSMKLIIMSATLNIDKLKVFFDKSDILHIDGRPFSISIYHSKDKQTLLMKKYVKKVVQTVNNICQSDQPGDILVFLTGKQDVESCCIELGKSVESNIEVLPLYGSLSRDQQKLVFTQKNASILRRVIVATNIAETSLTLSDIGFVVDCGLEKVSNYSAEKNISQLNVQPISKSSAEQRAGRCGRTGIGICFRLYTLKEFKEMPKESTPELLRSNLSSVVLYLYNLGLSQHEISSLKFVDQPLQIAIQKAEQELFNLGFIHNSNVGWRISELGLTAAQLPLEPCISKFLLETKQRNCLVVGAILAGFLSINTSGFYLHISRRNEESLEDRKQNRKDRERILRKVSSTKGDHFTFIKVFLKWYGKDENYRREWCFSHYINFHLLFKVKQLSNQVFKLLSSLDFSTEVSKIDITLNSKIVDSLEYALLYAFSNNLVLNLQKKGLLKRVSDNTVVRINNTSILSMINISNIYLIYNELVNTDDYLSVRILSCIQKEKVQNYLQSKTVNDVVTTDKRKQNLNRIDILNAMERYRSRKKAKQK